MNLQETLGHHCSLNETQCATFVSQLLRSWFEVPHGHETWDAGCRNMSEVHQCRMRYLGTLSNPGDNAIAQAIAGLKSGARVVPSY